MEEPQLLRPDLTTVLELHAVPPSLNRVGSRASWRTFRRHKRKWQSDVEWLLRQARGTRPLRSPCSVHAVLRFPQRRGRDEGNYRVLLEKATGDALVNAGYIPDDTPEHFRFYAVKFDPNSGPHLTRLFIQESAE